MCTYVTEHAEIEGSGRGNKGWIKLTGARVYYDHPFHSQPDHTLNIDFVNEGMGLDARVPVELSAKSARELVKAIEAALKDAEKSHLVVYDA